MVGHPPPDVSLSVGARLGTIAGGGTLAAIVASLPTEMRVGDGGVIRTFEQWFGLAALLAPLAIVFVAIFRRARAGLTLLAGERAPLLAAAVLWWSVLQLGLLSIVGSILRAKTHHHGLAGVTFALFALTSGIVIGLLAARGASMLERLPGAGDRIRRVALTIVTLVALLLLGLVELRTSRATGLHTAAALVDILALMAASGLASTRIVTRWRALAFGGIPLAAAIAILGIATLRTTPNLSTILAESAPVQAWLLGLLGQ